MDPIQVIGDRDTVLAFALGAVPGHVVDTADEARAAVDTVAGAVRARGGPLRLPVLLLITRTAADRIRAHIERVRLDPGGPLVVEIPSAADASGSLLERGRPGV
jgi:vacuolar-type H+-ATPase subunit F/Vma7